ncbi:putative phage abortive infection protein [Acinetobacter sp. ANC 4470]|uniref:putative phage abortive infection protein n=1 Tax=Acinetobacter sp. ANC 4470 TaxID=1977881 RepID=UPI00148AAA00|nr:putative phage abortive infection protein [Acinetobacter sp. ANC 4470]
MSSKIVKWIIAIVIGIVSIYGIYRLVKDIYWKFYQEVSLAKDSQFQFVNEQIQTLPYITNDYISNWGAFGDFVGGTLNPLLTFISVCLLLYTLYQNKKSLDFNSEELALSRKAQQDSAKSQQLIQKTQNLQQFDSLFFSLLNQFKHQQDNLCSLNENDKSKVDKIYRSIFVDGYKLELEDKRYQLLQHQELNQYFICLFQLFKLINMKINRIPNTSNKIEEWGDFTLEKQYTNILRSLIPPKLQQLLFLNTYTEFDEYRWYLSYYSFFEHMPFKDLVRNNVILIDLLIISKFYKLDSNHLYGDYQVFGNSIYFDKLLSESCYSEFMKSEDLFFSAWGFIENKFFNFKSIVCFFNSVPLSNLDKEICYQYYLINLKNEELRIEVIDVFRNSLEPKLFPRSREKVQLKHILFKNYGFQIQMEGFEKLDFYIYDEISVLLTTPNRSRNLGINETNQADFLEIELKENPL